jgi:hypothetical protein
MTTNMYPGAVVEVIWEDATSDASWTTKEADWPEMRCVTLGYFLRESERAIMLFDSMFRDTDEKDDGIVGGIKTIPKGMIVDIRVLRESTSSNRACRPDKEP